MKPDYPLSPRVWISQSAASARLSGKAPTRAAAERTGRRAAVDCLRRLPDAAGLREHYRLPRIRYRWAVDFPDE